MTKPNKKDSATKKISYSKGFDEGIATLKDEIQLALQWDRPSILIAVHNSLDGQREARQALQKEVAKLNMAVEDIRVDEQSPDVIKQIGNNANASNIVFFISGLESSNERSKGNVYQALNLQRETLVEKKVRVVFWLTESEAAELPHHAPDLWAFRHRVIEFAPKRGSRSQFIPAGFFLWQTDFAWMELKDVQFAIENEKSLLSQIPTEDAAFSSRVDLLLKLIQYYWYECNDEESSNRLVELLALLKERFVPSFMAWAISAQAIFEMEGENKKAADRLFEQAVKLEPENSRLVMNAAIAAHAFGRNKESELAGRHSVQIEARNPILWRRLGQLQLSMSKIDDAIESLKTAKELETLNIETRLALAIALQKNGQAGDSESELIQADEISFGANPFFRACADLLNGNSQKAIRVLSNAIETGSITKKQISRDPNLGLLMKPKEMELFR